MKFLRSYRRLSRVIYLILLIDLMFRGGAIAQVAAFTAPDTVCVGETVNLTNNTTGGNTYYWSFCSGNASSTPTGTNIGNPGNLLNIPTYLTLVKQGNDCFSFVSNQGSGIVRYYHGTSFRNNPVSSTNLGTLGTSNQEGIQVKEENGQWYGFVCSNTKLVRLNFGNSLWNAPTATDLTFSGLNMLHGLVIMREGTTWVGFATCSLGNTMVRFNFGTSLANTPVLTNFGNIGGFSSPSSICLVQENSLWYGLISAGNNSLSRISFGTSLLNTPTGTNLGNPGGMNTTGGITLIRDCESTTGYFVNYLSPGQLGRLSFPAGIAGTVTSQMLGNIGNLDKPHSFSEIFRQNDTLYAYVTNRQSNTLTRFAFTSCNNATISSSMLYNPPTYSYNSPGVYNVMLVVNEGQPNQASVCKNIVVLAAPCNTIASFTAPDTVCVGQSINIINQSTTGASYYWSFCSGSALSNPIGVNIGNPGSLLNIPTYPALVQEGDQCYSFIPNQGSPHLTRYFHGTSFSNNPVSWTNLGNFGMINDSVLGLKICKDNGQWIGFILNNKRLIRLNFGTSPGNTPTATQLGPFSVLWSAHCIDIQNENGTWVGLITCSWGNKIVRINFGNSLLNTPVLTDLGTPGSLNMPAAFRLIKENGSWYCLVSNYGNNTLSRLNFSTSLLNTPVGTYLGNPCPGITAGGLCLIRDCDHTTGFELNYSSTSSDLIWRLTFPTGITGTVTGTSLGNIGGLSRPSQFSELFRVGDTLFVYNTNRNNFTLTRHRFMPCSNASVPSSTLYNPPPFSYNQPGTYSVQLIVNEGLPTQASLCKSIVVKSCNTVAAFSIPDTVCVGEPVNITNQSTTGGTYLWNFCSGNALSTPVGTNIGNPGSLLNIPVYMTLCKDGDVCYSFIANQGTSSVIRYNHGSSFSNAPVSWTNLGSFGYLSDTVMGLKMNLDNGQWIGFVNNNNRIVRLNFGASLSNTPAATLLGPYSLLDRANCIDVIREGTTWIGLVSCSQNHKLIRLNFGSSLLNTPTLTDLGSPGTLNKPGSFRLVNENGSWYMLIVNYANSTLSRISFGNSLLNTPTGVNLGVVCSLNQPGGITLLRDCEGTVGFQLHYSNSSSNLIWRLNFPQGITGTATSTALGNIGSMSRPSQFSEVFRVGDTLFLYNTNQLNGTLTRLRFLPCSNASAPSSTLYSPPAISYNQPGTYNIQLTINEGLYDQATLCKNLVVVASPCSSSASFTAPDTVCVGAQINLINTSAGGSNYYWNFCSGNAGTSPVGTNIGNPGSNLNQPTYITLVKDGNDCFTFVANQGLPTHITRIYHGSNFRNPPVSVVPIVQTGVLDHYVEAIQIRNDNGQWYGFVNNNTTILRLNFGASLWNNSPTVTDLGPFPVITVAHGLVILKEGNTWLGFFDSDTQNKLFRMNFGNSLANIPVITDFGNLALFNKPYQIAALKEGGVCYLLIVNMENNSLSRISFGSSYLNTPTGQNLGNCGGLERPVGLTLLTDCEITTGYYTVYNPAPNGAIGRLTFNGGIGGTVAAQSLGNLGTLSYPHSFSELFRQNDSLFAYVTNRGNSTLTRFSFPPCTNASVPSSTLFTPAPFSYNAPGNYPVRLVVNEGEFSESSICKTITVMPPPVASLGNDRMICPGTNTTLDAGDGFNSYLWSTGATSRMITVAVAGSYWVKVTKYGCFDYDTVLVSLHPVMPVNLGPNTAVCEGQSMTFNAGSCAGCSYIWSNLTSGQPVIGTTPSYTTGTAGVYAVKVTSPDGCITGDTVELSVNPVPIVSATPSLQTICSGSNTNISITSTSTFSTYSWSAELTSGNVTGYASGFGNTIQQQLINQNEIPGVVTYTIIAALGSCFSTPVTCPVTVNPAPSVTNTGSFLSLCSGSNVVFTPLSNISGTLFNWTATGNLPELSGFAPGSGPVIDQQLFNSGFSPGTVTYSVIPTALGCNGLPGIFTATVNPIPDLWFLPETLTVCSGSQVSVALNSHVDNTSFSWEAAGSSGSVSNFFPGSGNLIQQTPVNSGALPETVTYSVTPSASGCNGAISSYSVIIHPIPSALISGNLSAICSGDAFQADFYSPTPGTTFAWSASSSSPFVSGYYSGNGPGLNQVISSASIQNENVTYEVIPSANGCTGLQNSFSVLVKPLPDLAADPLQQTACHGQNIVINLASGYSGAGFSWTASTSSPAVTGFSDGSGTQISQALFNSGTTAEMVTYQIISSLNGCSGSPVQANVMTIPVPDLQITPPQQTICNGQTTALLLTSSTENTNYSWTATGSATISGYSAGSGATIAQPLINLSNTTGSVTYFVTPSIGPCSGNIVTAPVTISPGPAVTFRICTDTVTTLTARPFLLKGALPPGGSYSGPGVESSTGIFDPSVAGIGLHQIIYIYENFYGCEGASVISIRVINNPSFLCGSMLTDPRDEKQYPTWQLSDGKCWMAGNLAYGTAISSTIAQTDNCISEHYCLQDNSAWCNLHGGFYQWEELMEYTPEPGSKGLCPPGWHIPQASEWLSMLAFNLGQSQAAGPLRDPWLVNGFHGVPSGIDYLNVLWHFCGVPMKGTFYWTSTPDQPSTAFARGLNDHNQSISLYPAQRGNAFQVRCVRDD